MIGFDNAKYIETQSAHIKQRIAQFGGKLYLEFGGKLFDDYHASRVLPGFEPDSKIRMLSQLKDEAEIIVAISAGDIEKKKIRNDYGIAYEDDVLRLIDIFRSQGFLVESVVVTQYSGQLAAKAFIRRLRTLGIRAYRHYPIEGYPKNIPLIVSDEGYGRNEFVETSRPLVVVTAPGPGSGKLATCLSQLYHEHKRGVACGYAKFETFPIWNLPLKHPVNIAYEAATADLNDINLIDPFHLEAYGKTTVNYNRDVEAFPVLKAIFKTILGHCPYQSPTDMGVNMAGNCIVDDDVCRRASNIEILRRYYTALSDRIRGLATDDTVNKIESLMVESGITTDTMPAVGAALAKEKSSGTPAGAMQLADGTMVTSKTSSLLGAASALLLTALRQLAGIDPTTDILDPDALSPICRLKTQVLHNKNPRLHSDELLIALAMSAPGNEKAKLALDQIDKLRGLDAHFSVMLGDVDRNIYKRLGIQVSCEPRFERPKLYMR